MLVPSIVKGRIECTLGIVYSSNVDISCGACKDLRVVLSGDSVDILMTRHLVLRHLVLGCP